MSVVGFCGSASRGNDGSIGWSGGERGVARGQEVTEEVDGLDEVALSGQHHEVDGVEVLFAAEAAAQVGSGIDGGLGLAATRTDEQETPVAAFAGPVE